MNPTFTTALRALCASHNITIDVRNDGSIKLIDKDSKKSTFERYASFVGLDASHYGRHFRFSDGRVFKIVGLLPNRPKNCVEIQNAHSRTGKTYICSPDAILRPGALMAA